MTPQRRLWEILEPPRHHTTASRIFDWGILTLIALNILAVLLESVDVVNARLGGFFPVFQKISIAVFTVEYLARLWSCAADGRFSGVLRGRLRFALTPLAFLDLLAILPAFLSLGSLDLRVLRGLRLLRVFRLFKTGRYAAAPALLLRVVRSRREELVLSLTFMGVLLLVAATLIYHWEHAVQPDRFTSIPASLWWAVTTLTTVGYGDVVPLTLAGKITAGFVSVLGLGFFALPTSILVAGFLDELKRKPEPRTGKCPRCGYRP